MRIFYALALLLLAGSANAQSPYYLYGLGGNVTEDRANITPDETGGVFVALRTQSGTVAYDSENGISTVTVSSATDSSFVLARYRADGTTVFAHIFSPTGGGATVRDIVGDGTGGVFVLGQFTGTLDFDPSATTVPLTSSSTTRSDMFIARYTASGGLLFAKQIEGQLNPNAIARDVSGFVIAGEFVGNFDIDPGAGVRELRTTPQTGNSWPSSAAFVGRFSNVGNLVSAFVAARPIVFNANNQQAYARDIAVDASGNIYLTGRMNGQMDFDPTTGDDIRGASGYYRPFVSSYSAQNTLRWVNIIARASSNTSLTSADGLAIAVSTAGTVFIGGIQNGDWQIGSNNTPGGPKTLSSTGVGGYFASLSGSDGSISSTAVIASDSGQKRASVSDILIDPVSGGFFLSGEFSGGTVDFGLGLFTGITAASGANESHFLLRVGGGTVAVVANDAPQGAASGRDLALGLNGAIYQVGLFSNTGGSIDFDPQSPVANLPNRGGRDLYLMRINASGALPVELTHFEAVSDGSDVVLSWATATETNNAGFAVEHSVLDVTGERVAGSEWREVGFVEGAGTVETPRAYGFRVSDLPAGTHQFRLKQVDFDGAFEYSPLVEATVVPAGASLAVYPQPAVGSATVRLDVPRRQRVAVQVYDLLGRVVETLHTGEAEGALRLDAGAGLPAGVYVVRAE
ncbi:MAG: T9SS type A sorting domain-containing protein, partial [Bacteroidota bacterium]